MRKKKALLIIFLTIAVIICLVLIAFTTLKQPGWHPVGKLLKMYTDKDGTIVTGYRLIDNDPYYFSDHGIAADEGWIEDKGKLYYCTGEGQLATGWKYLDKKAYYFYRESDRGRDAGDSAIEVGCCANDYTTTGGIYIPDKGYLEGDEALAVAYALDVLDRYGWSLESAFRYASALRFVRNSEELYDSRIHQCAIQGFKYGEGNCLAWVGTFCAMAKVMGYDCRLVWGKLPYRGEMVPHGWAEIWEEDGIHVYDPRMHEGEDMSGFDMRYGEKGSRKYDEDSKVYFEW